jgi:hypothetical protein
MNRGLSNIVDLGVSKTELQEYFDKLEWSYFKCTYVFSIIFKLFIKVA